MDNNFNNNYENFNTRCNNTDEGYERSGMATASLIVGVFAIVLGYFTGFMGIILGIVAILLGIFSKGTARTRSGKAIAGIITGAVGLVLGLIMVVMVVYLLSNSDVMGSMLKQFEGYQNYLDKAK